MALVAVVALPGFAVYWQAKHARFHLQPHVVKFHYSPKGQPGYQPLLTISMRIRASGPKPTWWGNRGTWLIFKKLEVFDIEGNLVRLSSTFPGPGGKILSQQSGWFEAKSDSYYQVVSTAIPPKTKVNGGKVKVQVHIVNDKKKKSPLVFHTATFDFPVEVDCNGDAC